MGIEYSIKGSKIRLWGIRVNYVCIINDWYYQLRNKKISNLSWKTIDRSVESAKTAMYFPNDIVNVYLEGEVGVQPGAQIFKFSHSA